MNGMVSGDDNGRTGERARAFRGGESAGASHQQTGNGQHDDGAEGGGSECLQREMLHHAGSTHTHIHMTLISYVSGLSG